MEWSCEQGVLSPTFSPCARHPMTSCRPLPSSQLLASDTYTLMPYMANRRNKKAMLAGGASAGGAAAEKTDPGREVGWLYSMPVRPQLSATTAKSGEREDVRRGGGGCGGERQVVAPSSHAGDGFSRHCLQCQSGFVSNGVAAVGVASPNTLEDMYGAPPGGLLPTTFRVSNGAAPCTMEGPRAAPRAAPRPRRRRFTPLNLWYCLKYRLCRQWWACFRRLPRRTIRTFQWCCGQEEAQDLCFSVCDFYSLVVSAMLIAIVMRNRMKSYCVGVRYSSDYICSEKYVSFDCSFPQKDYLEDEELYMRCGVSVGGTSLQAHAPPTIKPHNNDTIETNCGKPTVLLASMRTRRYIRNLQDEANTQVPNIVHYTIDCSTHTHFTYINYLSFVSVEKFIKPDRIYVHCDCVLNSTWWIRVLEDLANIHVVERHFPEFIQSQHPRWPEHRKHVMKLQTLFHNGGIHLDLDVLVIRSFDRLRTHEAVIGQIEGEESLDSSILLSKPHSPFVCLWMNSYRDYDPWPWQRYKHSRQNLRDIAERLPHHVHIERHSLLRPGPAHAQTQLYEGNFEWKFNFAVKLWPPTDNFKLPSNEDEVKRCTSSLGDIIRHILREPEATNTVPTTTARASSSKKKPTKPPRKDKKDSLKKNKNKHSKPTKTPKKQKNKNKERNNDR